MTHEAFKEAYNSSKISVSIDKEKAIEFMSPKKGFIQHMQAKRKYGYFFSKFVIYASFALSLMSFLMIIFGSKMSFVVPISMFIIAVMLSSAIRKSVCSFMLSEALQKKEFYEMIQKEDKESKKPLFTMEKVDE